jgi:DNA-binding LytR/AlgR family response regulator
MMIDCMIIDDEPLAHDVLETFISKFPHLRLVKKCTDAYAAIDFVYKNNIDMVFLDISMPEVDGITFLKALKKPPLTIFTTAYREYALDGYDLNIIDFLLKPFSFSRFAIAINKATERIENNNTEQDNVKATMPAQQNSVFIRSGLKVIRLDLDQILYIEGMKDYLKIYLPNERIIVKETLKNMEDLLPDDQFIRVHKSYIVSRQHIKTAMRNKLGIGNEMIPVGRNFQELVHRIMRSIGQGIL